MNVILRPAGPEAPQVYWTRRLVVLGGAVLVLVLLITLVSAALRGGGDADAAPPEGEDSAGVAGVDADAPAEGTRTCTAADLQLAVTTDATSYPAAALPTLTIRITNTGATSCAIDAGDTELEILITSGSDRIWSSVDCVSAEAPERLLLLAAGASDDETTLQWARIRSNQQCGTDLPAPRPGWYRAVAKLAGAESQQAAFELG